MEKLYKNILNNLNEGFAYHEVLCDEKGNPKDYIFIDCNSAFEQFTGLKKENILNKRILQIIPKMKSDKVDWIKEYGEVALEGKEKVFEAYSSVLSCHYKIKAFSPKKNYFITLFSDISNEINKKEEIQDLYEHSPYEIYKFDAEGRIIFVNSKAGRNSGYSTEELINMNISDFLLSSENYSEFKSTIIKLKVKEEKIYEYSYSTKTGLLRYGRSTIVKKSDNIFIAFSSDITEIYKTRNEKYSITQYYKKLFENLSSGCAVYNVINDGRSGKDYIIEAFNKKSLKMENKTLEEVVGKSLYDLRPSIDNYGLINVFRKVWVTGETAYYPVKIYVDENFNNYYENRIFRLSKNKIVALYNDVTELMQTQIDLELSNKKLDKYFNGAPYGIFIANNEGYYIDVNKVACDITGYTKEELLKMNLIDIIADEDKEKAKENFSELHKFDSTKSEFTFICANGEKRTWIVNAMKLEQGKFIGFTEDITDTKNLTKKVKYEKSRADRYLKVANIMFLALDINGNIKSINKKGCEILATNEIDSIGMNWFDNFLPEEQIETARDLFNSLISGDTKNVSNYENPVINSYGEEIMMNWHNSVIKDEEKNISGVVCSGIDITERKRVEKELINSEKKHRTWIENSPVSTIILDEDFNLKFMSKAGINGLKLQNANQYYNKPYPFDFYPELFKKRLIRNLKRAKITKKTITQEYSTCDINRKELWLQSTIVPILTEDNNIDYFMIVSSDITEQVSAKTKLNETQAFLQAAFDNSYAGIAIADAPDGKLRYVNEAGLLIRDKSEHEIVKDIDYHKYVESWNILHHDGTPYKKEEVPLARAVLYGEKVTEEFIVRRDSFEDRFVLANAAPILDSNGSIIAGIVVFMDITENKIVENEKNKLEAQLRNQQKLESIGTLASGVAHEINNPINGILNYGQLIADIADSESDISEYANKIIDETNRVSEIVKNLLDFSRQNKQSHSYANIEDIISRTLSLIKTIFKHDNIIVDVNIAKNISPLKCRSQQIQQVFMNLLTNAKDSLNEKFSGYNDNKKIEINCLELIIDNQKFISISVKDFGMGIPKEIIDKIYDPFYTTKPREKGTGLGLSISYGIIQDHHGEINVQSVDGEFTEFKLILPCDYDWDN